MFISTATHLRSNLAAASLGSKGPHRCVLSEKLQNGRVKYKVCISAPCEAQVGIGLLH